MLVIQQDSAIANVEVPDLHAIRKSWLGRHDEPLRSRLRKLVVGQAEEVCELLRVEA